MAATRAARPPTVDADGSNSQSTSLQFFREFIVRRPDGALDTSQLLTRRCFEAWLATRARSATCTNSEPTQLRAFRRVLVAHVTGTENRSPFTPEEEESLLACLRGRHPWQDLCGKKASSKQHEKAFRAKGFHEKRVKSEGEQEIEVKIVTKRSHKRHKKSTDEDEEDFTTLNETSSDSESVDPLHALPLEENPEVIQSPSLLIRNTSYDQTAAKGNAKDQSPHYLSLMCESLEKVLDEEELAKAKSSSPFTALQALAQNSASSFFNNGLLPSLNLWTSNMSVLLYWITRFSAQSIKTFGEDWWGKVHEAGRLGVLSFGFVGQPKEEDTDELVREITESDPEVNVVVIDHQIQDYKLRFISQNENSVETFGTMARRFGGTRNNRFHHIDTVVMFRAVITAYMLRGQEVKIDKVRMRCKDGKFRWFESSYQANPDLKVLVERSKLIDDAPIEE